MKRSAEIEAPASKKPRILPPLNKAADAQKHVFLSLPDYDKKVGDLFYGDHDFVFIRGGVATGKTTLAEHLGRQGKSFVKVQFTGSEEASWEKNIIRAVASSTEERGEKTDMQLDDALKRAKENDMTLILDEAHTVFSSGRLSEKLFKSDASCHPKVLLVSASGEAPQLADQLTPVTATTPSEITQKFMWTPPLSYTSELKEQLGEAGVKLDEKSIEFFIQFCGGHRGIFIAAMHWVNRSQNVDETWNFTRTVEKVRKSYGMGEWNCPQTDVLGALRESRAVRVNGQYTPVSNIPREFAELLCQGASRIARQEVRRELTINGFVLPKYDRNSEDEFQRVDWVNEDMEYQVANPLLASYYLYNLKKHCGLEVWFENAKPHSCADLLMRALPCMFFAEVVCSLPSKEMLPYEDQYNKCIQTTLKNLKYEALEFHASAIGQGKPDCAVQIAMEMFVLEGVMHARGQADINTHLERFTNMDNYKNASHKGLYIIGNDSNKMLKTMEKTEAGDVQVIGLVPNIAHTAYTVHIKSKGISRINTCNVDCDLVARRLVLKDDGNAELYSVQSLKSVNLSPKAETRPSEQLCTDFFFACF